MHSETTSSYLYYQRLGFANFESWSQKDLHDFFFSDYFDGFATMMKAQDIAGAFYREHRFLVKKYNRYKLPFMILDKIFLWRYFLTKKTGKKSIVFRTSLYDSIVLGATKKYHVGLITQGKKDRLFAIKHFLGYVGINDAEKYIIDYLDDNNIAHLHAVVKKLMQKLQQIKPDYVVMRAVGQPMERAIVLACKNLAIPTLSIQHGNFDKMCLYEHDMTDYILVWGNYFKDLYVKPGIRKPEDIFILGYPHPPKSLAPKDKASWQRVCYLGQDLERYNKEMLPIKLQTISQLTLMCQKLNLEFMYRPHPGDDRVLLQEKLPDVVFTKPSETLQETFTTNGICISFSSTALFEAAIAGNIVLQLMNYPVIQDNFQEVGSSIKTFTDIKELDNYLADIAGSADKEKFKTKLAENYLQIHQNPTQRFLEIMHNIETRNE